MFEFTQSGKKQNKKAVDRFKELQSILDKLVADAGKGIGPEPTKKRMDDFLTHLKQDSPKAVESVEQANKIINHTQDIVKANKKSTKDTTKDTKKEKKELKHLLKASELEIEELIELDKIHLSKFAIDDDTSKKAVRGKFIVFKKKKHEIKSYRKHRLGDHGEYNFILLKGFEDPQLLKDIPQVIKGWIPIDLHILTEVLKKSDTLIATKINSKQAISPEDLTKYITLLKEDLKQHKLVQDEFKSKQPIIQTSKGTTVAHAYQEIKDKGIIHLKNYPHHTWVRADSNSIEFAINHFPRLIEIDQKLKKLKPFDISSLAICLAKAFKKRKIAPLIDKFPEWKTENNIQITTGDVDLIKKARQHLQLVIQK